MSLLRDEIESIKHRVFLFGKVSVAFSHVFPVHGGLFV